MTSARTHGIAIVTYLLVSALLFGGVIFLGVQARSRGETTAETTAEPSAGAAGNTGEIPETDIETGAETGEPPAASETAVPLPSPEEAIAGEAAALLAYLEEGAPLRWALAAPPEEKADSAAAPAEPVESADTPETVPETAPAEAVYEQVYPVLAYYYEDLETGTALAFHADDILYAASLIKAPFIWAVLEEIDDFEKNAPRDADGAILYQPDTEKYRLDTVWVYDPVCMMEEGSGELMKKEAGFTLSWRELFAYALLYSDNIAFAQIRERFGYEAYYTKAEELGIRGVDEGFMQLSARDCALFLREIHAYLQTDTENARMMRRCMGESKHLELIASHYPPQTALHKYGWDIGAFHDMALVEEEHPYLLVIMTDYEDGGETATDFVGEVVEYTKRIHAAIPRRETVHPEPEILPPLE